MTSRRPPVEPAPALLGRAELELLLSARRARPEGFGHVGTTLILLRELKEKSQHDVAKGAGIGKSQLSKYENGRELPKLESLGRVLAALDLSPLAFFYAHHLVGTLAGELQGKAEEPIPVPGSLDDIFQLLLQTVLALYGRFVSSPEAFRETLAQPSRSFP